MLVFVIEAQGFLFEVRIKSNYKNSINLVFKILNNVIFRVYRSQKFERNRATLKTQCNFYNLSVHVPSTCGRFSNGRLTSA